MTQLGNLYFMDLWNQGQTRPRSGRSGQSGLSWHPQKAKQKVLKNSFFRQQVNQLSNLQAWEDIGSNLDQHNVPQKATNTTIIFFVFIIITSIFYSYAVDFANETSSSPLTSMYLSMLGRDHLVTSHTALFSPNLFDGQITQISIHQLSDPENKKCSPWKVFRIEPPSNQWTFEQERP